MFKMCPICGFESNFIKIREIDNWHPNRELSCPRCQSAGRHRMIWLIYNKFNLSGRMLHCSPMGCLKDKFVEDFDYVSIDFPPRTSRLGVIEAGLNVDLRNTDFKDDYFDVIICTSVLDHIKETEQAIKEIFRILKPGGIAFIIVPIFKDIKSEQVEKPVLGNWWRCGLDFFQKYVDAGFETKIIEDNDIKDYEKYGLTGNYLVLCYKQKEN